MTHPKAVLAPVLDTAPAITDEGSVSPRSMTPLRLYMLWKRYFPDRDVVLSLRVKAQEVNNLDS